MRGRKRRHRGTWSSSRVDLQAGRTLRNPERSRNGLNTITNERSVSVRVLSSKRQPALRRNYTGLGHGLLVKLHELMCHAGPGEIGGNSVKTKSLQQLWRFVESEGFAHSLCQCLPRILIELNAVGALEIFPGIDHGVVQSACCADDRDGRISQTVHLVKAAGFKTRRHQKKIAARFNAMREGWIEA